MKTIKTTTNKKINIPQSLDDLSYIQFIELMKYNNSETKSSLDEFQELEQIYNIYGFDLNELTMQDLTEAKQYIEPIKVEAKDRKVIICNDTEYALLDKLEDYQVKDYHDLMYLAEHPFEGENLIEMALIMFKKIKLWKDTHPKAKWYLLLAKWLLNPLNDKPENPRIPVLDKTPDPNKKTFRKWLKDHPQILYDVLTFFFKVMLKFLESTLLSLEEKQRIQKLQKQPNLSLPSNGESIV